MTTLAQGHRDILLEALRRLAEHVPIEHRAYGPSAMESRQRWRDADWARPEDHSFDAWRAVLAAAAREALDAQPDDALVLETLGGIADEFTHEDRDALTILKTRHGWVEGSLLASSHCANIARSALRACGYPAKPETVETEMVERFVASLEERRRAAHALLATRAEPAPDTANAALTEGARGSGGTLGSPPGPC